MPGTIAPTSQLARPPHLDNGDQRAILVEGGEGPAQIIGLRHWRAPSLLSSDDGATSSPPAPYHLVPGISGGGLGWGAPQGRTRQTRTGRAMFLTCCSPRSSK